MARRRGTARAYAGEGGALFVATDGVHHTFDDEAEQVYPTTAAARKAWQSVRRSTWEHPDRETVFPPTGAVYDGMASRVEAYGFIGRTMRDLGNTALLDLAAVDRFRRDRPAAAAEIAEHLDEYAGALRRLLDLGRVPTTEQWTAIFHRQVSRGTA